MWKTQIFACFLERSLSCCLNLFRNDPVLLIWTDPLSAKLDVDLPKTCNGLFLHMGVEAVFQKNTLYKLHFPLIKFQTLMKWLVDNLARIFKKKKMVTDSRTLHWVSMSDHLILGPLTFSILSLIFKLKFYSVELLCRLVPEIKLDLIFFFFLFLQLEFLCLSI